MTGFHLMQHLHAYSGGTVRDLHTILYSPVELLPLHRHLNTYLLVGRITPIFSFVNKNPSCEMYPNVVGCRKRRKPEYGSFRS